MWNEFIMAMPDQQDDHPAGDPDGEGRKSQLNKNLTCLAL